MKKSFHRKIFLLRLEAESHLDGLGVIFALPVLFITLILNIFGLGTHRKVFPELHKNEDTVMNYLATRFLPAFILTAVFVGVTYAINYIWGFNQWVIYSISVFLLSVIYGFNDVEANNRASFNFARFKEMEAKHALLDLFWDQCDPEVRRKWFIESESPEFSRKRKDLIDTVRHWESKY